MGDKTPDELRYSRPLDVHKWSDHDEVNEFVNELWDKFHLASGFPESVTRGKRPKASLKQQFKVLLLDLYVAWLEDPDLVIGVSFTKAAYKPNSRYNALHISYKIVDIIYYLHEVKLLGIHKGSEYSGLSTRIWPTEKLRKVFHNSKLSHFLINPHADKEVIILNNREPDAKGDLPSRAKPQEYDDEDYAEIPRMREEIRNYNELLRKSFIDIGDLEEPVYNQEYWDRRKRRRAERHVHINHHNKFVRRVFYRGSWQLGGRLHGGFWQQIKDKRKDILINDFHTVELDFSGLHINLAYALEGRAPQRDDPYTVEQVFNTSEEQQRQWVKDLSLMAINTNTETSAIRAFRAAQPTGSEAKSFNNQEVALLLKAFKEKHPHIQKYLCSDQGVRFMNIDGAITSNVIKHFTDKEEPVLSVHDSFICREQVIDELNNVMNEVVSNALQGYIVRIKANREVEHLSSRSIEGVIRVSTLKDPYSKSSNRAKRCDGYERRWLEHQEWLHIR